jgi:hypothetical protein
MLHRWITSIERQLEILAMGHMFGTSLLVVAALFGCVTALFSGLAPARFAGSLGLAITNTGGLNEIRAQYAGVFFAIAAVCMLALAGNTPRQAAFIVLAVIFSGLIAGRLVSLVLNRGMIGYGPAIRALYGIDSVGLLLSIVALLLDRST